MAAYNYKSDFDFILALVDCEGREVGFPSWDWRATLRTSGGYGRFEAECTGGVCRNCYNDDGRVHIVCDNHGLGPGELHVEFEALLPDSVYPDGTRREVEPLAVGIELVRGAGDCPGVTAEAELPVAAALVTAYDMAVAAGYNGTREDYVSALTGLTDAVAQAQATMAESVEAARTATEAAETARTLNEQASAALADVRTECSDALEGVRVQAGAAIDRCSEAAGQAAAAVTDCGAAADEARGAASECVIAAGSAASAAESANAAAGAAQAAAERAEALNVAVVDRDNAWSAQQTFGDITVRGNIIQQGEAYETHAEVVYTVRDMLHLREGAVSGIPAGSYAGLVAQRYNGTDDGYLVYDAQGARVGKAGDTEPLLTRAEKEDMVPFAPLVWDAQRNRAVSGEWPELPELPVMRTVEMVVTYEDDSTETFNVYVQ